MWLPRPLLALKAYKGNKLKWLAGRNLDHAHRHTSNREHPEFLLRARLSSKYITSTDTQNIHKQAYELALVLFILKKEKLRPRPVRPLSQGSNRYTCTAKDIKWSALCLLSSPSLPLLKSPHSSPLDLYLDPEDRNMFLSQILGTGCSLCLEGPSHGWFPFSFGSYSKAHWPILIPLTKVIRIQNHFFFPCIYNHLKRSHCLFIHSLSVSWK